MTLVACGYLMREGVLGKHSNSLGGRAILEVSTASALPEDLGSLPNMVAHNCL